METLVDVIKKQYKETDSKIVMLVFDGLGGLPDPKTELTELETAKTPNLDKLAYKSEVGLSLPVGAGITPGSGPGHLGLFGYDPVKYLIGRGILEALGIDFPIEEGDICIRANFCTLDKNGNITDRRAGRIPTSESRLICDQIDGMEFDGVKVIVRSVKDHRCVVVLRGKDLSADIADTDPQQCGVKPLPAVALSEGAKKAADVLNKFLKEVEATLKVQPKANMILLRGISSQPDLPSMKERYGLNCAAIAAYPMYRGLAKVVGMDVLKTGTTIEDEINTLKESWSKYDFFFVHVKGTDAAGEDGDFMRKVQVIEDVDRWTPDILKLKPDCFIVCGDHSTPAMMKSHSWHGVPLLINSKMCRYDKIKKFGESECRYGSLMNIPAANIMPLALANAGKLDKYGA